MKCEQGTHGEVWIQGQAVVSGIAIGLPFFLRHISPKEHEDRFLLQETKEEEVKRFRQAIFRNQEELQQLSLRLFSSGLVQEADLVEGALFLATDSVLINQIEDKIRNDGKKAVQAIAEVREDLRNRFRKLSSPYLQQRFDDVEGVCDRLLSLLVAESIGSTPVKISADAILCAPSVTAPVAAKVSVDGIGAIVTTRGGAMSHTAIVARSRGIPYISDIDINSLNGVSPDMPIIVDGMLGIVIIRPNDETIQRYMELKKNRRYLFSEEFSFKPVTGVTKDGSRVKIYANIAKEADIYEISQYTLDGVGLYRTEYQVLEKCRLPTEEDQVRVYSEMVKASQGRHLVIRVFDFGADKGWKEVIDKISVRAQEKRALSLLLECKDILRTQLRALLRASAFGPISILFPMVSSLAELTLCLDELQAVYDEVSREQSVPFPRIGAMLEIPSILFHAREIAERVDFLSLGTNDLIQYALAVDRSNTATFDYHISFHPGLMHLIRYVVKECNETNIPLCVCGEMASDPLLVPFLVGLGVNELSMAPRLAPSVRKVLLSFTKLEMQEIAEKVLMASSAQEVYLILRSFYATVVLEEG